LLTLLFPLLALASEASASADKGFFCGAPALRWASRAGSGIFRRFDGVLPSPLDLERGPRRASSAPAERWRRAPGAERGSSCARALNVRVARSSSGANTAAGRGRRPRVPCRSSRGRCVETVGKRRTSDGRAVPGSCNLTGLISIGRQPTRLERGRLANEQLRADGTGRATRRESRRPVDVDELRLQPTKSGGLRNADSGGEARGRDARGCRKPAPQRLRFGRRQPLAQRGGHAGVRRSAYGGHSSVQPAPGSAAAWHCT
jgi:hypothetical protein